MTRVYLLFFLSGISGLIYEVTWVRQFGNCFGNTVYSASLVSGTFMCGLGVGGYLAGRWADRVVRDLPLRAYAWSELAIGVFGLVLARAIPLLEGLSAATSSYVVGAHGWHYLSLGSHLVRYLLAIALVLPPALLMGGTLTLLIRHVVGPELALAGWRIALLYAVNTGGAAIGGLLTDALLIPSVGIIDTQTFAAALNFVAGVGALRLARREPASARAEPAELPPDGSGAPLVATGGAIGATALAIALSGFAGMGMEILWFRFMVSMLGGFRAVFSVLLAVILLGIWLGALAGGWIERRFGRPGLLFAGAEAAFLVATMACFGAAVWSPPPGGEHWEILLVNLRRTALVVLLPATLMGFAFPLANACVQRVETRVGGRAGVLYLANTLGAVLGSIVTGFVLLPGLGMQRSVGLLALVVIGSIAAMIAAAGRDRRAAFAPLAAVAAAWLVWGGLDAEFLLRRTFPPRHAGDAHLDFALVSEGLTETLAVADVIGSRILYTNGHPMSATNQGSQRYMRAFSHLPLLMREAPERALVICFGVGNTLHAASTHPSIRRLEIADLSENVLGHAHEFARWNHDVLLDPRVAVFVNDGRQHLRMQPEATYDLITLEPPPPGFAGVSALYSREFYALARSRLVPGGFMSQWLPIYQLPPDAAKEMIRAFIDIFPVSVLLSGNRRELILLGVNGAALTIDPARLAARIESTPGVAADLAGVALGTPLEIVGTFAASARTLAESTKNSDPVTDDRPTMEYSSVDRFQGAIRPEELFDTADYGRWCPTCLDQPPAIPALANYLQLLQRYYLSPQFRLFSPPTDAPPFYDCADPVTQQLETLSEYLRAIAPCPHS
jgi:spermidine synthase